MERITCEIGARLLLVTTSFDTDSLTWPRHAPANGDGIFAAPLVQLLPHLLHLGWIEGPQTAFTRRVAALVLYLDEALVEGEVVTHRVLPPVGSCLRTDSLGR